MELVTKNIRVLATTVKVKANWKEMVPPPKMGNLKDPEKIAAKQAEWEDKALKEAKKSRLASSIDTWSIGEASGKGDISLGAEINKLYSSNKDIVIFGLAGRLRISQLQLSLMQANEPPLPPEFWHFPRLDDGTIQRVNDPLTLIRWTGEEPEQIARFFGLREDPYEMDLGRQTEFVSFLVGRMLVT